MNPRAKKHRQEEDDRFTMAMNEIAALIKSGDTLAQAAHHVQAEHDGVHRLRLALSEWYKTRADEFGRGKPKPVRGEK